jgi:hypothetical protein
MYPWPTNKGSSLPLVAVMEGLIWETCMSEIKIHKVAPIIPVSLKYSSEF